MLLAVACFSGLDSTAKYVNRSLDPLVTVWARYVVSMFLTAMVINPWTQPGVMRTTRPGLQLLRSTLLLFTTICSFTALKYLQLVENMAIQFSTPLIVALLAGPMLGERVGPRRLAAIVIGLAGVLIITRPGLGIMHPAALITLAGAIGYSFFGIVTRLLARHDSSATTTFYSGIVGIVTMTAILPWIWIETPSLVTIGLLLLMGRIRGGGSLAPGGCPCAGSGNHAFAIHVFPDHLDAGARLCTIRRLAGYADVRRRRSGDRLRSLSASS